MSSEIRPALSGNRPSSEMFLAEHSNIATKTQKGRILAELPLFAWAAGKQCFKPRPLAYSARWVRRRIPGISPAIATAIAEMHFGQGVRS